MSKAAKNAILEHFEEELTKRLPQFQRVKDKAQPGECRLFVWRSGSDLSFFILISVLRAKRFFIDVAWSDDGEWPRKSPLLYPRDVPEIGVRRDPPEDGTFRFRLPMLWRQSDQRWDLFPKVSLTESLKMFESGELDEQDRKLEAVQELMPKILELVRDAVDKIEIYAMPYLAEVARGQGG